MLDISVSFVKDSSSRHMLTPVGLWLYDTETHGEGQRSRIDVERIEAASNDRPFGTGRGTKVAKIEPQQKPMAFTREGTVMSAEVVKIGRTRAHYGRVSAVELHEDRAASNARKWILTLRLVLP